MGSSSNSGPIVRSQISYGTPPKKRTPQGTLISKPYPHQAPDFILVQYPRKKPKVNLWEYVGIIGFRV